MKEKDYKPKTIVKGIRASSVFFDDCDKISKKEGTNRNELIVRVVSDYIKGVVNNNAK